MKLEETKEYGATILLGTGNQRPGSAPLEIASDFANKGIVE